MRAIGLVGGICSGKSLVAGLLERLGARVIRADEIGHEVLRRSDIMEAIRKRWGDRIFDAQGQVDRSAVARKVFDPGAEGTAERKFLESITHPLIREEMQARLDDWARRGDIPAVVLDAAVLFEAGWVKLCDQTLFVDADLEQRLERARRRGWSDTDFSSREAAQLSLQEKRKLADWVIDNSGTMDHTFAQVRQFWQSLDLSPPEPSPP